MVTDIDCSLKILCLFLTSTPSLSLDVSRLKKHKDGCLCAICVMMRRRQEREESARMFEDHAEASDDYIDEEARAQVGLSLLYGLV